MEQFSQLLSELINRGMENGVPPLVMIGAMETLKVELITNMLVDAKDRQSAAQEERPLIIRPS